MLTDMKTLLAIAEKKGCAIPAFNVYNAETTLGAIFAAEETSSVCILQMYSRLFSNYEAEFMIPSILAAAQRSHVKFAFHLDHGASDEAVARAIRYGATSVMRDASDLPLDENIAVMQKVTHFAHDMGISVEGELGHVGIAAQGVSRDYTKVDEAVKFVNETGVDALAILVGTAHGHYTQAPVLAIDHIREIKEATGTPLVLHGGSGVPDDQIKAAVKAGIRKINFGTDVCCSLLDGIRPMLETKVLAIDLFMKEPTQNVKRYCIEKIKLCGSEGTND